MGFLDKIQFWKKSEDDFSDLGLDDLNLGDSGSGSSGAGGMGSDPPGIGDPFGSQLSASSPTATPNFADPMQAPSPAANTGFSATAANPMQGMGQQQQVQQSTGFNDPTYNSSPQQVAGFNQQQQYQQQAASPLGSPGGGYGSSLETKDIELISVKLDSLRTSIDTLNQRLDIIERLLRNEHERRW